MVIPQLSDVLEQVDRQMLLILKTNDLIRGIESTLGTKNRMTAFWVMSKCCVHSSFREEIRCEPNQFNKWRLIFSEKWAIFKLNIYYLYMGLINYGLFTSIKQLLWFYLAQIVIKLYIIIFIMLGKWVFLVWDYFWRRPLVTAHFRHLFMQRITSVLPAFI